MNVIVAIPCLNRGGTEMQTLSLVRALADSGHAVTTVCYFENDPGVVSEYVRAGSPVERMNLHRSISPVKLIGTLMKMFKNRKPDVVHVQYMAPGALPVLAARLAGVKCVFATVHQPWTMHFHGIKGKLLLRFSSMLTTCFIAVSESAELSWFGSSMLFNASNPLTTKRTHLTMHNAIDIDRIDLIMSTINKNEAREKLGLQNKIVLGSVSRLSYEKGIDLLLEAFSSLFQSDDRLRLLIVGSGPDETKLKLLAQNRGMSGRILFTGSKNRDEAIEMMSLMDIVVCPSRFEGFGLTAAEAMACRKPVIANNTGGLSEVVRDKITGLLTATQESALLAETIQMLISNRSLAEKMGEAAREVAETRFSYKLFASRINQLYDLFSHHPVNQFHLYPVN